MLPESMDTGEVEIEKIPERGTAGVKDGKAICWHNFEVAFGANTFLRYCKLCGMSHVMRPSAESWSREWRSVEEESE